MTRDKVYKLTFDFFQLKEGHVLAGSVPDAIEQWVSEAGKKHHLTGLQSVEFVCELFDFNRFNEGAQ